MTAREEYEKARDASPQYTQKELDLLADAALAEADEMVEWLGTMNSTLLNLRESVILELNEKLAQAERERDLAIAHDRQPYPTAWAYEQVCAMRDKAIDELRKSVEDLAESEQRVRELERTIEQMCDMDNATFTSTYGTRYTMSELMQVVLDHEDRARLTAEKDEGQHD